MIANKEMFYAELAKFNSYLLKEAMYHFIESGLALNEVDKILASLYREDQLLAQKKRNGNSPEERSQARSLAMLEIAGKLRDLATNFENVDTRLADRLGKISKRMEDAADPNREDLDYPLDKRRIPIKIM